MASPVIQSSFSAGELSPTLFGRVDLNQYHLGAALMKNFFVDYRGGATTRAGLKYVTKVLDQTHDNRLIRFQFSTTQQLVLELGEHYMRFISQGAPIIEVDRIITAITHTTPPTLTIPGHDFSVGNWIFIKNVQGMTELNGQTYIVINPTATTVQLEKIFDGAPVPAAGYGTYTSGGFASRVYTISTPWAGADLKLLKFDQSANIMTFTHPNYPPQELIRISDTNWTLSPPVFQSSQSPPTGVNCAITSAAGSTLVFNNYVVTAVSSTGEESLPSNIASILGDNMSTTLATVTVAWTQAASGVYYNIYKTVPVVSGASLQPGTLFGYAGSATLNSFSDTNFTPNFTKTPPTHSNPFAGNNWPGTCCYYQQRHVFAGSTMNPTTLWGSKTGNFKNFDSSIPVNDGDAYQFSLVSLQVNPIKHLVPMPGGLIVLTGSGAWQMTGNGQFTPITPSNVFAQPQAYNGANDMPPITIDYDILFCQLKGSLPRDLSYNFFVNIYTGLDLTVFSNHLFQGHELVEWAYSEEPFKVIWCIRDDGVLLSLTYLKSQQLQGWAQHDTNGRFKSVCTVLENNLDTAYFVVERRVNGVLTKYIEQMANRNFRSDMPEDCWCVDSGLQNVSGVINTPCFIGPLVSSGPESNDLISYVDITISAFNSGYTGYVFRGGGGLGDVLYVSPTRIQVAWRSIPTDFLPNEDQFVYGPAGPNADGSYPSGDWTITAPIQHLTGLDYMEGNTLVGLGDGNVIEPVTVVNGKVTLDRPYSKIILGLAFQPQLQCLRLDVGEPTVQTKRKRFPACTARLSKTRGLKYGDSFDSLYEAKEMANEFYGQPLPLITGDQRVPLGGGWNEEGQICFQQDYPLPASILAVIPEVSLGDNLK